MFITGTRGAIGVAIGVAIGGVANNEGLEPKKDKVFTTGVGLSNKPPDGLEFENKPAVDGSDTLPKVNIEDGTVLPNNNIT